MALACDILCCASPARRVVDPHTTVHRPQPQTGPAPQSTFHRHSVGVASQSQTINVRLKAYFTCYEIGSHRHRDVMRVAASCYHATKHHREHHSHSLSQKDYSEEHKRERAHSSPMPYGLPAPSERGHAHAHAPCRQMHPYICTRQCTRARPRRSNTVMGHTCAAARGIAPAARRELFRSGFRGLLPPVSRTTCSLTSWRGRRPGRRWARRRATSAQSSAAAAA